MRSPDPGGRDPSRSGARRERARDPSRRAGAVRRVRRPVRARGPDPGAGRARRGLGGAPGRPRVPRRARRVAARLRRPPVAADVRAAAVGGDRLPRLPQARGPEPHRARTRSTTRSARCCWPGAWASAGSSPRPGPAMHGVATATACALFGLPCVVYMGEEDTVRQAPNVARMQLLGAEVVTVTSGSRTLKDALNEALRDWAASVVDTHYVLGSVVGTAPVPGDRARPPAGDRRRGEGRRSANARAATPTSWSPASAGERTRSGSSTAFVPDPNVGLVGVEAGGRGDGLGEHCRSLTLGEPGVLHGSLLLPPAGRTRDRCVPTHSISAGLDYPGVGPEHAFLKDSGPCRRTSRSPTPRRSRASARSRRSRGSCRRSNPPTRSAGSCVARSPEGSLVLVNLSGRGDKDLETVRAALGSVPGASRA